MSPKDLIEETVWTIGFFGGIGVAIWAIVSMIALM